MDHLGCRLGDLYGELACLRSRRKGALMTCDASFIIRDNAFEALCALASDEKWCWKLTCTTCGAVHFKAGLRRLGDGEHPLSSNWQIHRRRVPRLGGPPGAMELGVQRSAVSVLIGASIQTIAERCRFPNWLGFLGVALSECSDVEAMERALTDSWRPELREMVHDGSGAAMRLEGVARDLSDRLSWADLELIEQAFSRVELHSANRS